MTKHIMENYYTNTKRKVLDFIIGFFGILLIMGIFLGILSFIGNLLEGISFSLGLPLIHLIIGLLLIILFFKIGRRYIAIGIIWSTILSTLLYGIFWIVIIVAMKSGGGAGL